MLESIGDCFYPFYLGLRQNRKRLQCVQHFYDLQQQKWKAKVTTSTTDSQRVLILSVSLYFCFCSVYLDVFVTAHINEKRDQRTRDRTQWV